MTWSYADATDEDLLTVRDAIGDINPADPLIDDEPILRLVAAYGVERAGSIAARRIAAVFARKMDKSSGPVRIAWKQRFDNYMALADALAGETTDASSDAVGWAFAADDEEFPTSIFTRHMGERYADHPLMTTGRTVVTE